MVLGPVLPHAGCWLGLQPHPVTIERQYLTRARRILPLMGIPSFIAAASVLHKLDWQGSNITAKTFWCIYTLLVVVPLILVNLCLLCLRDLRTLRHVLYFMFFIFLAVAPSVYVIRDIENQNPVWAVVSRRALHLALFAMVQFFCFGSVSGQMLLLTFPSHAVYLGYRGLIAEFVQIYSNSTVEFMEIVFISCFSQTVVAILCISFIWRRCHLFTPVLAKVTPNHPNVSSSSIMPVSLGKDSVVPVINVSSQVSVAPLSSLGAPEVHAADAVAGNGDQEQVALFDLISHEAELVLLNARDSSECTEHLSSEASSAELGHVVEALLLNRGNEPTGFSLLQPQPVAVDQLPRLIGTVANKEDTHAESRQAYTHADRRPVELQVPTLNVLCMSDRAHLFDVPMLENEQDLYQAVSQGLVEHGYDLQYHIWLCFNMTTQILTDQRRHLTIDHAAHVEIEFVVDSACPAAGSVSKDLTVCVWFLSGKPALKLHMSLHCAEVDGTTVGDIVRRVGQENHLPPQRICLQVDSEKLCESTRVSVLSNKAGIGGVLDIQAIILAPRSPPYPKAGQTRPPLAPHVLDDNSCSDSADSRQTFQSW